MVKSKVTDRYYSTLKKCTITSTFDQATAQAMVGERIPGSIQRQACDPYSIVAKETGEVIELSHRWVYLPEGASMEEASWEGNPEVTIAETKSSERVVLGPL